MADLVTTVRFRVDRNAAQADARAFEAEISEGVQRGVARAIVEAIGDAGRLAPTGSGSNMVAAGSSSTQPSIAGPPPPVRSATEQPSVADRYGPQRYWGPEPPPIPGQGGGGGGGAYIPNRNWGPAPPPSGGGGGGGGTSPADMAAFRQQIADEQARAHMLTTMGTAGMATSLGGVGMGVLHGGQAFAHRAVQERMAERQRIVAAGGVDPGMGAMAYAMPVAAAAVAAGAVVISGVNKDSSYIQRRAELASAAEDARLSGGLTRGDGSELGPYGRHPYKDGIVGANAYEYLAEQGFDTTRGGAALRQYAQGVGHNIERPSDWAYLSRTGASPGAIASYDRLQMPGIDAGGDAYRTVEQATVYEGLRGDEVDRRIHSITGLVERLAMQGVQVNAAVIERAFERSANTPGLENMGVRRGQMFDDLANVASGVEQDFVGQWGPFVEDAVRMRAWQGSEDEVDMVRNYRRIKGDPEEVFSSVYDAAAGDRRTTIMGNLKADPSLTVDEAEAIWASGGRFAAEGKNATGRGADLPPEVLRSVHEGDNQVKWVDAWNEMQNMMIAGTAKDYEEREKKARVWEVGTMKVGSVVVDNGLDILKWLLLGPLSLLSGGSEKPALPLTGYEAVGLP